MAWYLLDWFHDGSAFYSINERSRIFRLKRCFSMSHLRPGLDFGGCFCVHYFLSFPMSCFRTNPRLLIDFNSVLGRIDSHMASLTESIISSRKFTESYVYDILHPAGYCPAWVSWTHHGYGFCDMKSKHPLHSSILFLFQLGHSLTTLNWMEDKPSTDQKNHILSHLTF